MDNSNSNIYYYLEDLTLDSHLKLKKYYSTNHLTIDYLKNNNLQSLSFTFKLDSLTNILALALKLVIQKTTIYELIYENNTLTLISTKNDFTKKIIHQNIQLKKFQDLQNILIKASNSLLYKPEITLTIQELLNLFPKIEEYLNILTSNYTLKLERKKENGSQLFHYNPN